MHLRRNLAIFLPLSVPSNSLQEFLRYQVTWKIIATFFIFVTLHIRTKKVHNLFGSYRSGNAKRF